MRLRDGWGRRRRRCGDDRRFEAAGLSWPLPEDDHRHDLEEVAVPPAGTRQGHRRQAEPDWARASRAEAQARHAADPLGRIHRARTRAATATRGSASFIAPGKATLSVTMRQTHAAGEKLFVDYAGDRRAGRHRSAHRRDAHGADLRRRAGRIELHLRQGDLDAGACRLDRRPRRAPSRPSAAFPRWSCPTTPRSPSIKASLYDPRSTGPTPRWRRITAPPSCRRGREKPRDKAKVEQAVLIVERWLLGRLRHRTFSASPTSMRRSASC